MTCYGHKTETKNNSLCQNLFPFATIRLVKMVKENELCLVFVKCVFSFGNIRHFVLVPSPLWKRISLFGHLFKIILKCPSTEIMYSIVLISLRLIQPPENDKKCCRLAEKISVLIIALTCHVIIYHFTEL